MSTLEMNEVVVERATDESLRKEERELMAHRYLYYIACSPVISDYQYDYKEKCFRDKIGEDSKSPINFPGSDLKSSYTSDELELAMSML